MITDLGVNVNLREKQEFAKDMSSGVSALSTAEPTQESQARCGGTHLSGREAEKLKTETPSCTVSSKPAWVFQEGLVSEPKPKKQQQELTLD